MSAGPNKTVAASRARQKSLHRSQAGLSWADAEAVATAWRAELGERYMVRRTGYNTGPYSKPIRKHCVRAYLKEGK